MSRDGREATDNDHDAWLKAIKSQQHVINVQQEYAREKEQRPDLYQWFIKPPVKIDWQPINADVALQVIKRHIDSATGLAIPIAEESPIMRRGAMVEYLLPQGQLTPVLIIQPRYTLQAIAAAIYAERVWSRTASESRRRYPNKSPTFSNLRCDWHAHRHASACVN